MRTSREIGGHHAIPTQQRLSVKAASELIARLATENEIDQFTSFLQLSLIQQHQAAMSLSIRRLKQIFNRVNDERTALTRQVKHQKYLVRQQQLVQRYVFALFQPSHSSAFQDPFNPEPTELTRIFQNDPLQTNQKNLDAEYAIFIAK